MDIVSALQLSRELISVTGINLSVMTEVTLYRSDTSWLAESISIRSALQGGFTAMSIGVGRSDRAKASSLIAWMSSRPTQAPKMDKKSSI
jgi:hypothetical protein